ncbi:hypothetical protein P608_02415 [Comamonas thiooxydans]|uniref:Uncharacterized protein n=1 Tax=Comamonas thiooxydans TaxID=363952 RepID=A0A0E3C6J3_9BURK|nr:hypothetical protein P608_02415 [Comamonas thiooxydans]
MTCSHMSMFVRAEQLGLRHQVHLALGAAPGMILMDFRMHWAYIDCAPSCVISLLVTRYELRGAMSKFLLATVTAEAIDPSFVNYPMGRL